MGKWRLLALGGLIGLAFLAGGVSRAQEQLAPYELQYLTKCLLEAMNADSRGIAIYETDGVSHSVDKRICINASPARLGPVEFVAAHECGHIAANHSHAYIGVPKTKELLYAIEKEADLMAAQALHDLGLDRAVLDRIAELRLHAGYVALGKYCEDENHPTLAENAEYLTQFMIDQGYAPEYIDEYCLSRISIRENELKELGIDVFD